MAKKRVRLGADIGGTFTDIVLECAGALFSQKVLTTHDAPEVALIDALLQVCQQAKIQPGEIDQVIHGTTLATNALIERRGAKTALITTKGFRDVLEMRTESRFEQYDLNLTLPKPLLPRSRRFVIEERLDADGNVLIPLQNDDINALSQKLAENGIESLAIGLLHAYVNDAHERQIAEALSAALPDMMLSLSSEVSPKMREYERFSTTVANAYIKPLMQSYLNRLKACLKDVGVFCPVFLMHSGGGLIDLETAAEFPVRLVESGPAGGAIFAADLAKRYHLNKALSFDMGGTTAKICMIKDHAPKSAQVFEVARSYRFKKGSGMPISIPVIDLVEIGAGGGSLAKVDELMQIRVGPESAGSEPGPASYGRGGESPAVSDADLILGRLDPTSFSGGAIELHVDQAQAALMTHIGKQLEMSDTEAAVGISEMVDENMASAARVHAVEKGEDLSEYTMIAFGGAAPLHAGRLCQKLNISRCLIPKGAGVGSAIGFLRAPYSYEVNQSDFMPLADFDPQHITHLLEEMKTDAEKFVALCADGAEIFFSYEAHMRYAGQGWEVPVALQDMDLQDIADTRLARLFEATYKEIFSRSIEGIAIEITGWSVKAYTAPDPVTPLGEAPVWDALTARETRAFFDPALMEFVEAKAASRVALTPGNVIEGPAVITEDETSTIIPSAAKLCVQKDGTLDISLEDSS